MLDSNNRANLLSCVAITAGIISSLLRVISLLFFYDREIGYYSVGAVLPIVSNVFFALCALALAFLAFRLPKNMESIPAPAKLVGYFALIPAVAMLTNLFSLLKDARLLVSVGMLTLSNVLAIATAVISVVFFVSLAFSKQPSSLTVICGVGFIVWIALAWIRSYTDFFVAMNSPDKIFFHLGCMGAALLAIAELRCVYLISKPRFYYFSLWISLLTLSTASLPAIAGNLGGIFARYSTESEDFVLLALFIYATVRALSLLMHNEPSTAVDITETEAPDTATDENIS